MGKHRYALRLAYPGPAFRGFQRQPGLPTVQGALDPALEALSIRGPLATAARTDAGVNAIAQVVSFTTAEDLDPAALRARVNALTPESLLCLDAARVPSGFHARASALSRTYVYLVGSPPPPELAAYAWTLPDPRSFPDGGLPDADRVRAALLRAVGRHDFRGFARPGEATVTVRELLRAEVIAAGSWLAIVLEGRGFLRAMVRHLVGTAVAVGLGKAEPELVSELLATGGRYRGVRAPAWGLTLVAVRYPEDPFRRNTSAGPAGSETGARPIGP